MLAAREGKRLVWSEWDNKGHQLSRAELIPVLTPFTPFFKTELAELS